MVEQEGCTDPPPPRASARLKRLREPRRPGPKTAALRGIQLKSALLSRYKAVQTNTWEAPRLGPANTPSSANTLSSNSFPLLSFPFRCCFFFVFIFIFSAPINLRGSERELGERWLLSQQRCAAGNSVTDPHPPSCLPPPPPPGDPLKKLRLCVKCASYHTTRHYTSNESRNEFFFFKLKKKKQQQK